MDGVYKSFWKWDCSSCNPKDFCEHLTREKMFSRWRDCKKCNPAQWVSWCCVLRVVWKCD